MFHTDLSTKQTILQKYQKIQTYTLLLNTKQNKYNTFKQRDKRYH